VLQLTEAENAIEKTSVTVTERKRELCEAQAAKTEEFANAVRTFKAGRAPLREARRTLRLMADEWRQTCQTVDDACELMMGSDSGRPSYRLLVRDDDDDDDDDGDDCEEEEEDDEDDDDDDESGGGRHHRHRRRGRHRRRRRRSRRRRERPVDGPLSPTAIPTEVIEYFEPMDRRLDDVLQRVFWIQNDYVYEENGPREQQEVAAGDSMSTTSEQEDEFLSRDLDGTVNRHAKIIAARDPTTVTPDNEPPERGAGRVPSLCPR